MSGQHAALAAQQRALLALLKDRPDAGRALSPERDPYLDRVRGSAGLAMLRTIATWWRRYDLQRQVPLTSRLLEHEGRFERELGRLAQDPATPTPVDALGLYFLERLVDDSDPLVAAVARTERALLLAGHGDRSRHTIPWDRDPAPIVNALLAGETPGPSPAGRFQVVVSTELPTLIAVEGHADRSLKGVLDGRR